MEQSAFEQLAQELRLRAFEASRLQGTNKAEAEDIAQEVMLRLWQMHKDLYNASRLGNLASLMARNLSIDRIRQTKTVVLGEEYCQQMCSNADPSTVLEENEDEEWLQRKLKQLPNTQHTILFMRQAERLSTHEIAKRLGITEPSVVTLLSRARKSLLEEIKRRNK